MRRSAFPLAFALSLVAWPCAATGAAPSCEHLAEQAAASVGIPTGLMTGIARAESGRGNRASGITAWPWTLNQGGKGSFHASRAEALDRLTQLIASGVQNIDIGCMQINYRWHRDGFGSVEDMMDPVQNTRYAARFLRMLRDRLGTWDAATAAYHSLDVDRGQRYLARVATLTDPAPTRPLPDATSGPTAVAARIAGLLALPKAPLVNRLAAPAPARPVPAVAPLAMPTEAPAMIDRSTASLRLQRDWDDLANLRRVLAARP